MPPSHDKQKSSSYITSLAWSTVAGEQEKSRRNRQKPSGLGDEEAGGASAWQQISRVNTEAARYHKRCIVDPRSSNLLPFWDLVTGLALTFTATATPYEVAYLPVRVDGLFWVNRTVDVIFCIDLVLNFFLAFPTEAHSSQLGAHWVEDRRLIVRHYLTGWFSLDLFSTPRQWRHFLLRSHPDA